MSKVLRARHAIDVGGRIVEPGQPIPDDVDADVVKRLQARGQIGESGKSKRSTKTSSKSSEGSS